MEGGSVYKDSERECIKEHGFANLAGSVRKIGYDFEQLTRYALLGNDEIRLDGNNGIAHSLDLFLFNLQDSVPVLLLGNLDIGLGFSLLVLQGTVEKDDSGVLNAAAHLGVGDVLVEHEAVQHSAVLNLTTGHLFDTSIALDVDFGLAIARFPGDCSHGFEGKVAHLAHPPGHKFRANRGRDELVHGLVVVDVNGQGDFVNDFDGIFESALKCRDDDDGMNVAFELR